MTIKKTFYAAGAAVAMVTAAFAAAVLLARLEPVDVGSITSAERYAGTGAAAPTPDELSAKITSPLQRQHTHDHLQAPPPDQQSPSPPPGSAPSFNADAIFAATQKVRLDEYGSVVLDHDTMTLLQRTLGQQDLVMDELALAELKDLVEYAMPGPAGTQVALIVGNYYEFLRAKEGYETRADETGQAESYEDRQRQIQLLRETYLGADVADRLFAQSDAENAWMRANIELAAQKNLTEEERHQQLQEIRKQYVDSVLSANGWTQRYQQFVQQKEALIAVDGDDSETRERAITELWHTHFSAEEREKMMALQIPAM